MSNLVRATSTSTSASDSPSGRGSTSPFNFRKRFGWEIQRRRLARRWTQAELAEMVGMSLKYMGEIERGEANLTAALIEDLTSVLNWDLLSTEDKVSGLEAVRLFLHDETTAAIERMDVVRRVLGQIEERPVRQGNLVTVVEPTRSPRTRRPK